MEGMEDPSLPQVAGSMPLTGASYKFSTERAGKAPLSPQLAGNVPAKQSCCRSEAHAGPYECWG